MAYVKNERGLWLPENSFEKCAASPQSLDDAKAPYVLSEIESSLTFVNVEFVVCTALLITNAKELVHAPLTGMALFSAFVFFLFGGLCFAVAGGEVARGPRGIGAANAALEWGNILTEWFGLYMLLLSIPIVVQLSIKTIPVGWVSLAITLAGYAVYVVSRYDLLSRFVSGKLRLAGHIFFATGVVLNWAGVAYSVSWLSYSGGGAFLVGTMACAVLHKRRGEFGSGNPAATLVDAAVN